MAERRVRRRFSKIPQDWEISRQTW